MNNDNDQKQTEADLRRYAIIIALSAVFGFAVFDFNWWLILKIPVFVSGTVLLYAIDLYKSRTKFKRN